MIARGAICVLLSVALSCDESEARPTTVVEESVESTERSESAPERDPAPPQPETEPEAPSDEPSEPPVGTVEPGDRVDDGSLDRAPARVRARVRRLREGEEDEDHGGYMIAPDRFAFGLPAISADGQSIAVIESQDAGDSWDTYVFIVPVQGGGARAFHTSSGSMEAESDYEEMDEAAREAAALPFRRVARDLNVHLREGGYRSMTKVPQRPDEPALRGVPILLWDGDRTDEVVIRDPGNSAPRYHALAPGQPREPMDPDSDEPGSECYADTPNSLVAWFAPDPDTVVLDAWYSAGGDSCGGFGARDVFRLPALRAD